VTLGPQTILVGSVVLVGVLHTMVPDHWLPLAIIARQQKWSRVQVALAALQAGAGHVFSTLVIAALVWALGAETAKHSARVVDTASSICLVVFGLWTAASAWQESDHVYTETEAQTSSSSERKRRITLLLILGSSPMVEGIPAFFAASKYGIRLLLGMAAAFSISTIVTYVALCVLSTVGLQRFRLASLGRYGEVLSGVMIAVVGLVFWLWGNR
jgi:nickel/cobalt exporter